METEAKVEFYSYEQILNQLKDKLKESSIYDSSMEETYKKVLEDLIHETEFKMLFARSILKEGNALYPTPSNVGIHQVYENNQIIAIPANYVRNVLVLDAVTYLNKVKYAGLPEYKKALTEFEEEYCTYTLDDIIQNKRNKEAIHLVTAMKYYGTVLVFNSNTIIKYVPSYLSNQMVYRDQFIITNQDKCFGVYYDTGEILKELDYYLGITNTDNFKECSSENIVKDSKLKPLGDTEYFEQLETLVHTNNEKLQRDFKRNVSKVFSKCYMPIFWETFRNYTKAYPQGVSGILSQVLITNNEEDYDESSNLCALPKVWIPNIMSTLMDIKKACPSLRKTYNVSKDKWELCIDTKHLYPVDNSSVLTFIGKSLEDCLLQMILTCGDSNIVVNTVLESISLPSIL